MQLLQDWGLTTFPLANLPCLNSSMVRTKVTSRKGERGGETRMLRMRTVVVMGRKGRRPLSPVHPPSLATEAAPKAEEILQRIEEAGQLEGVGRSLSSLPTQQLAQMAAEAAGHLSWVGRSLFIRGSNLPWEAKPPERNSDRQAKWKKPRRYWSGIVALHARYSGSKRTQSSLFEKLPFSCS